MQVCITIFNVEMVITNFNVNLINITNFNVSYLALVAFSRIILRTPWYSFNIYCMYRVRVRVLKLVINWTIGESTCFFWVHGWTGWWIPSSASYTPRFHCCSSGCRISDGGFQDPGAGIQEQGFIPLSIVWILVPIVHSASE